MQISYSDNNRIIISQTCELVMHWDKTFFCYPGMKYLLDLHLKSYKWKQEWREKRTEKGTGSPFTDLICRGFTVKLSKDYECKWYQPTGCVVHVRLVHNGNSLCQNTNFHHSGIPNKKLCDTLDNHFNAILVHHIMSHRYWLLREYAGCEK